MTTQNKSIFNNVRISLIEVIGPPDNLYLAGCPGAFVTVVGVAGKDEEFRRKICGATNDLGLVVKKIEWTEILEQRLQRYGIDDTLWPLIEDVTENGGIRFHVFHAYEVADEEEGNGMTSNNA